MTLYSIITLAVLVGTARDLVISMTVDFCHATGTVSNLQYFFVNFFDYYTTISRFNLHSELGWQQANSRWRGSFHTRDLLTRTDSRRTPEFFREQTRPNAPIRTNKPPARAA